MVNVMTASHILYEGGGNVAKMILGQRKDVVTMLHVAETVKMLVL
jgi:hypothetical protein